MIRRPPRSTPLYSSAASDVYKRQGEEGAHQLVGHVDLGRRDARAHDGVTGATTSARSPDAMPPHPGVHADLQRDAAQDRRDERGHHDGELGGVRLLTVAERELRDEHGDREAAVSYTHLTLPTN